MNTNSSLVIVGNLEALVVHKPIKHLHLSVLPPLGKIRVTAPHDTKDDHIRVFLATKLAWIHKQQATFINQQRQSERRFVSGETHYYLGKPYLLKVEKVEKNSRVVLTGKNTIILKVKINTPTKQKEHILTEWYRYELKKILGQLIPKWHKKLEIKPSNWRIQRMKTRWGTCNPKSRRVLLNLELIKKPFNCIEYAIVHEWLHLIEPNHNENFVKLLSKHFPKWRLAKEELNQFILSYEKWRTN